MCNIFKPHKWSKWEEYKKTKTVRTCDNTVVSTWVVLKRTCEKCGLVQFKKLLTSDSE